MAILLTATSHTVMAQCSGSAYVPPTTTDCSCGFASCDTGGDQINGHNICSSVASGGTNCISHDDVIGVTKTCTSHVNGWAILVCVGSSSGCFITCVARPWACAPCLATLAGATGLGSGCSICGGGNSIISCTESDNDIHGQVYDSAPGTCPNNG
jgi:hypothetical protein